MLQGNRGQLLTGRDLKWSSSSPAIATVTASGQLTGMGAGSAKVTVESEGKNATVAVTIRPVPAASVVIEGLPATLLPGETATLRAVVKDAKGHLLTGREVSWTTGAAKVVVVSAAGMITAKGAGAATIIATVEGSRAEAKLTVAAPVPVVPEIPTELMPRAVAPAPTVALPEAAVPAVPPRARPQAAPPPEPVAPRAVVPHASGVTGKLIGALVGLAVIAGVAFAVLNRGKGSEVIPPAPNAPDITLPVAQVTIRGADEPVAAGRTEQLSAELKDASGKVLDSRAINWLSSDPAVASVSPLGAVTAHKAGSVTITARSEGQSTTTPLTIEATAAADLPAQVAKVTLTGGGKALEVGEIATLVARASDAKGSALGDRAIVWNTSDPQVALISSVGLVSVTHARDGQK